MLQAPRILVFLLWRVSLPRLSTRALAVTCRLLRLQSSSAPSCLSPVVCSAFPSLLSARLPPSSCGREPRPSQCAMSSRNTAATKPLPRDRTKRTLWLQGYEETQALWLLQ